MTDLRSALFLFCAVVLAAGQALAAETAQYTGKSLRDPFVDTTEVRPPDETVSMQRSVSSMTVQGILYTAENPVAIIDGKIYRVGSRLGAGQVVSIEKEGVTVSQNGKQFTIKQSRGKTNEPSQKKS